MESINPAQEAAVKAIEEVYECLKSNKSFVLEAGAGAGKTYSLVQALKFLLEYKSKDLLKKDQKIACITYTNVASKVIASRTDGHPAIFSSTIHAFCWEIIKNYQSELRKALPEIGRWNERLAEAEVTTIESKRILYDLGYPKVDVKEDRIWLGHNDVIALAVKLISIPKFRTLLTQRFPVIFFDEYQDTDAAFAEAIITNFLEDKSGPLFGFFGDYWQKIYGSGYGKIEHKNLTKINKGANFRSVKEIVHCLNNLRTELPQEVSNIEDSGSVNVFHTNNWPCTRLTGGHWAGDLPKEEAHIALEKLKIRLQGEGWEFNSDTTKILMLTHNVLAQEQGYKNLLDVLNTDQLIKKEDPYISFFVDTLEPVCQLYEAKKYGEMFSSIDSRTPRIVSHSIKSDWKESMDALMKIRLNGRIEDVLNHIKTNKKPRLSEKVENNEEEFQKSIESGGDEIPDWISRVQLLKNVPYQEIIAFAKFSGENSPFATKHGVKGEQYENVLVVVGRGWNLYNFNQMLEWAQKVPSDNQDSYERNRNLFYVACSRPKRRLAILFTQLLSATAMDTLDKWFDKRNIHALD